MGEKAKERRTARAKAKVRAKMSQKAKARVKIPRAKGRAETGEIVNLHHGAREAEAHMEQDTVTGTRAMAAKDTTGAMTGATAARDTETTHGTRATAGATTTKDGEIQRA